REGRAQQVVALVDRPGPEHGEDVFTDEYLTKAVCVGGAGAGAQGLLPGFLHLVPLTDVGGESHDLSAVLGLQPVEDHRGIQPARVGENDLVDLLGVLLCHACASPWSAEFYAL